MSTNITHLLLILISLLNLFLSFLVWIKNKKSPSNIWYSMVVLGGSLWAFGLFGFLYVDSLTVALNWARFYYIVAAIIAYCFLHFAIYFPFKIHSDTNILKILTLAPVIIIIYFLFFTDLHLSKISLVDWGKDVTLGKAYIFYVAYFTVYIIISFVIWSKKYKIADKIDRLRLKYVFIGTGTTLIFGSFFNLFLPIFNYRYVWVGPFFTILMIGFIFYAIVRYRLMNIRVIIARSILYAILVGTVSSAFALSVVVVGNLIGGNTRTSKMITFIIDAIIVVLFLDPVKRTWARVTDRIFYKDKIDYQLVLQEVSQILAREIDLQKLLPKTAALLTEKIKIKSISVLAPIGNKFVPIVEDDDHSNKQYQPSENFINYVQNHQGIMIVEELIRLQDSLDHKSLRYRELDGFIKEAESWKIEMVVPVSEEGDLTAVFLCSTKSSGDLYSQDDINFFKVLAPQVSNAIEKSELYEEVEEFNRELQAKVEARTKSLQEVNMALEERNKFLTTMQVVINMVSRTMDLKKITQMIADSIANELGYVGGILSFVDFDKKVLLVGAITQNKMTIEALGLLQKKVWEYNTPLQEDYNLATQTVLSGKINFSDRMSDFLSPPVEKESIDKIQKKLGIQTVVGVPIFSENKIIGIIRFLLAVKRDKIFSLDIETMTALTNEVGIVWRNLRLYENLQKANRDMQEANIHLRALDKAKSEFLSIASHQLRTPISAIKGYLAMMLDGDFGKVSPKIKNVLKDLFESSARLARLINVFLNVSRIESGRFKLDKKPIQINDLIESVIIELKNQAIKKELKLTYHQPVKKIPLVFADSDKLREVILNLVDNAIKYTLKGSIDIYIKHDKHELSFISKDTGIGIDPSEGRTLFRKFVRGTGVAQIHTGGSGLGLFIAQKIIKEHGGRIWAESKGKEKGSVFRFVIPLYDGQDKRVEK